MENKTNKLETLSVADLMFGKELLEGDLQELLVAFEREYGVSVYDVYIDDNGRCNVSLDI